FTRLHLGLVHSARPDEVVRVDFQHPLAVRDRLVEFSFAEEQQRPRFTLFPYTTLFRSRRAGPLRHAPPRGRPRRCGARSAAARGDRKSTRLNSSHDQISYAVFCLKKKRFNSSRSPSQPSCGTKASSPKNWAWARWTCAS